MSRHPRVGYNILVPFDHGHSGPASVGLGRSFLVPGSVCGGRLERDGWPHACRLVPVGDQAARLGGSPETSSTAVAAISWIPVRGTSATDRPADPSSSTSTSSRNPARWPPLDGQAHPAVVLAGRVPSSAAVVKVFVPLRFC